MKKVITRIRPAKVGDVCAAVEGARSSLSLHEIEGRSMRKGVKFPQKRYRTAVTMTVTKVDGLGKQKGSGEAVSKTRVDVVVREWDVRAVTDLISEAVTIGAVGDAKVFVTEAKLEIIANDGDADKLVGALCKAALGGKADGKIFVYPAEDAGRMRTKERAE